LSPFQKDVQSKNWNVSISQCLERKSGEHEFRKVFMFFKKLFLHHFMLIDLVDENDNLNDKFVIIFENKMMIMNLRGNWTYKLKLYFLIRTDTTLNFSAYFPKIHTRSLLTDWEISIDWSFEQFKKYYFTIDSICSWKRKTEKSNWKINHQEDF
jgi:hypothetical protein